MKLNKFCMLFVVFCLLISCAPVPAAVVLPTLVPVTPTLPAAVTLQAATPQDLFPVKTELRYAKTFQVEYHDTYKVLTVLQPWRDAKQTFKYILVQRGTATPADVGDAQVIEIPIKSVASLATTHLPYWDELGKLDLLVAVGNAGYINTPGVVKNLQAGSIKDVGNGPDVNLETLLSLQPELVTTLALGSAKKDDYQLLQEKGFKVVIVSDFMEETPLGRAEWVKFMALFTNQEAQAEAVFAPIEQRYRAMQKLTRNVKTCPSVVMGFEISGTWNMPGGKSYQAAYIHDAGGCYLWADDQTSGRIPLSFEAVYEKAASAEYWFNQSGSWLSGADVLAADPRYGKFQAFSAGHAYNNNARLNATGGNDYNEGGHANPDVILADLIAILHPELLPEHALVFHRLLSPGTAQK